VARLYEKGERLLKERRYEEAIGEFEKILALVPEEKKAIKYISEAREELERREREPILLRSEQFFNVGKELYEGGQYKEAIEEFEKTVSLNPEHKKAKEYLARSKKKLREEKRAEMEKQVAEHLRTGKRYYEEEQYLKAREEFEAVLALAPEHKGAQNYLEKMRGKIAKKEKEREEMLTKARKVKADEFYRKGKAYLKEGKYAQALVQFQEVLTIIPDYPRALTAIENVKEEMKRKEREEELARIEAERKAREERIATLFKKGQALYKREEYRKAMEILHQVLALDPEHKGAQDYLKKIEKKLQIE